MSEFTRSEKPFLLLAEDKEQNISYYWFDDEDELQMIVAKIIDNGGKIIDIKNGDARKGALGSRYNEVQNFINHIIIQIYVILQPIDVLLKNL